MANKLVLIGGGGHCKSVLDAALRMKTFDEIVITDPEIMPGTLILGCKIVGTDEVLTTLHSDGFEYAFITVGSIKSTFLRRLLVEKAKRIGFGFTTIIDPSASISESASIGEGVFIGKNAIVNVNARIGYHCIINSGAIIEHECIIGDFSHVSVGSILCGNVEVGTDSFIGAGSTVIQGIKTGSQSIVGAGSILLNDIPNNVKAYGNPCRVVK